MKSSSSGKTREGKQAHSRTTAGCSPTQTRRRLLLLIVSDTSSRRHREVASAQQPRRHKDQHQASSATDQAGHPAPPLQAGRQRELQPKPPASVRAVSRPCARPQPRVAATSTRTRSDEKLHRRSRQPELAARAEARSEGQRPAAQRPFLQGGFAHPARPVAREDSVVRAQTLHKYNSCSFAEPRTRTHATSPHQRAQSASEHAQ